MSHTDVIVGPLIQDQIQEMLRRLVYTTMLSIRGRGTFTKIVPARP